MFKKNTIKKRACQGSLFNIHILLFKVNLVVHSIFYHVTSIICPKSHSGSHRLARGTGYSNICQMVPRQLKKYLNLATTNRICMTPQTHWGGFDRSGSTSVTCSCSPMAVCCPMPGLAAAEQDGALQALWKTKWFPSLRAAAGRAHTVGPGSRMDSIACSSHLVTQAVAANSGGLLACGRGFKWCT